MTKEDIIENLNLVIDKQNEEIKYQRSIIEFQQERLQILMRLNDTSDAAIDQLKLLANNYAKSSDSEHDALITKLHAAEAEVVQLAGQLKAVTEDRNECLNKILDRQVTIGQLEDQVTSLRERVVEARREAEYARDAAQRSVYDPETII